MRVGQRLARARIAKKFTQDQLAKLCGISRSRLSGLERNRYDPRVPEVRAICDALCISADWWLREKANPHARLKSEIAGLSTAEANILCVMFDFVIQSRNPAS